MIDLDRETWWYLSIIILIVAYFIWNANRSAKSKKARKNRNFRHRYNQRKKEENLRTEL